MLLFSGHRVDAPGREPPRFPAAKVAAAAAAIEGVLDELGAGAEDLALTQGSAGGDLLFAEACLRRGVHLRLLLPLAEPAFVRASVAPSADGARWVERFRAVRDALEEPPRVARSRGRRGRRRPLRAVQRAAARDGPELGCRSGCASSACGTAVPATGPAAPGSSIEAVRRLGRPVIQVDARGL